MNIFLKLAAVACALASAAVPAAAQNAAAEFPSRPVHIVVPFPAGGPTDIVARIVAQKMGEDWHQAVIVENRPGGNTTIGAQVVARAAPDGYTLLTPMDTTLVLNPASGVTASYDPFKDFAAITLLAKNTSLLSVRAQGGPKSVADLIARAKSEPRQADLRRRHPDDAAVGLPVRQGSRHRRHSGAL